MFKKLNKKIKEFVGSLDIVKKVKFYISFVKASKNMERRNYKMGAINPKNMNEHGVIIKTDHDYVRSRGRLLGFAEFHRVSRKEKYTVLYVDNDFHKLSKVGQRFVMEQELSKIINLVAENGGKYSYVNSAMVFDYKETRLVDITTVNEMGLNEFVNGMNEVANFIDLTEFYEECTYRANSVISHLREIKYRPVEITGRDIVQSLWETYGEGIYNILSESAIRALNRVAV